MRAWVSIACAACISCAQAAPIDDALGIVFDQSATLEKAREEMREIGRQSRFKGRVYVGYALAETYDAAAGANAGIYVEIPLFSRKRELDTARARLALAKQEEALKKAFLADVSSIRELEDKRREAQEMAAFYKDRLTYFDQAVKEGRIEADTLWEDAEKAKKAEHDAVQGTGKVRAKLEQIARRYGGHRWTELQDLLAGMLKPAKSSTQ
ncbi:hypothetical protein [Thiolapillus sp.]